MTMIRLMTETVKNRKIDPNSMNVDSAGAAAKTPPTACPRPSRSCFPMM